MRVLLRDKESGFYYTAARKWAPDPDLAMDCSDLQRARELARHKAFRRAEIVLAYDGTGLRTPYTLQHRRCRDESLRRDFAEGLQRSIERL